MQYRVRYESEDMTDSIFLLKRKRKEGDVMTSKNIKRLVQMGLLAAMSVALRLLSIQISDSLRIGFTMIPILLAGIWYGPIEGMIVGTIADFIGSQLFAGLGYNPILTIGPMIVGLTAGLISRTMRRETNSMIRIAMTCICAKFAGSVLYMSLALSAMYNMSFAVVISSRIPIQAITVVVEILVIYIVYSRISKKVIA